MIKVKVTNYKAIREASFLIRGLSILRGASNQGKSSIIQSIKAAFLNRFNGTCVRHGQDKAQVAFFFADYPECKFYVTRKASGGSPTYSLHKQDQEPFVLSKLGRDEPPAQFSVPFGVTRIPIGDKVENLNFLDQFMPPLTLYMESKKIIEIFSNSQLLKEYDKVYSVLTVRRPILKGQVAAVEQVLYDTTQQLIDANALAQKLPTREELLVVSKEVQDAESGLAGLVSLSDKRSAYLKLKEMHTIQFQINTHLIEDALEQKEFESYTLLKTKMSELNKVLGLLAVQEAIRECTQSLLGEEEAKVSKLTSLKEKRGGYINISAALNHAIQIKETTEKVWDSEQRVLALLKLKNAVLAGKLTDLQHNSVTAINEIVGFAEYEQSNLHQFARLGELRYTYLTLTKSITTLKGLTSEEACPVCGSNLNTPHEHPGNS